MELYGRSPARNGSNPGHQSDWSPDGGETGLEGTNYYAYSFSL